MGVKCGSRKVCENRARYETAKLAKAVASKQQRRYGGAFNWFRCSICGGYHVGSDRRRDNATV